MRKAIYWIHLTVGVSAAVIILIMSLTGVLLTYQRQLTSWADGVSVPAHPNAPRLSIEGLLEKAAEAEGTPPSAITIQRDSAKPASLSFGREKTLFLDPYTGAVLGEGSKRARAFFQFLIDWHRWLGMEGAKREIGKAITGVANLGFLFLILSGIYLWWPRTFRSLKAAVLFTPGVTGKARDWNWHNVIGIWSSIPLAIIVFSAVFFSYPKATAWLYRAFGENPPSPGARSTPSPSKPPQTPLSFTGLNDAWKRVEAQVPGWRSINLRLPSSPSGPLTFTIDRGNGARPDLRAQLTMNRKTGEIEKWEPYNSYSNARRVRLWVRWLHTGEAGGWMGQTLAGAASAGALVLVWTGLALALRRVFKKKPLSTCSPD